MQKRAFTLIELLVVIVYCAGHAQFMPGKRIRGGVDLPCESPVVDPRKPMCP